jgi:hypothetical protein
VPPSPDLVSVAGHSHQVPSLTLHSGTTPWVFVENKGTSQPLLGIVKTLEMDRSEVRDLSPAVSTECPSRL